MQCCQSSAQIHGINSNLADRCVASLTITMGCFKCYLVGSVQQCEYAYTTSSTSKWLGNTFHSIVLQVQEMYVRRLLGHFLGFMMSGDALLGPGSSNGSSSRMGIYKRLEILMFRPIMTSSQSPCQIERFDRVLSQLAPPVQTPATYTNPGGVRSGSTHWPPAVTGELSLGGYFGVQHQPRVAPPVALPSLPLQPTSKVPQARQNTSTSNC